jgi:hypothetical protein
MTHGWYSIHNTVDNTWLCSIRPYVSHGKTTYSYGFSATKMDALVYRRKGAAERFLSQLIRKFGDSVYEIHKEESAGPIAIKRRGTYKPKPFQP